MKLSELIKQLQEIEKEHGGDIECYINDSNLADEIEEEGINLHQRFDNSKYIVIG